MNVQISNSQARSDVDPSLLIGEPSIDKEHVDLFSQLHALSNKTEGSPRSADFTEILSRMGQSIYTHFLNEEKIFKSSAMPEDEIQSHIQAHITIVEQYAEMNLALATGKEFTRLEVLSMVKSWIVGHIISHDIRIRDFLPKR